MPAAGGEHMARRQRGADQPVAHHEAVVLAPAHQQRRALARHGAVGVAAQPAPEREVVNVGTGQFAIPRSQTAGLGDVRGQVAPAQEGGHHEQPVDAGAVLRCVQQRSVAAQRDTAQPHAGVAARAGRLHDVVVHALHDLLAGVVAGVGVGQLHIDRQAARAHRLHEAFAQEIARPVVGAGQQHQQRGCPRRRPGEVEHAVHRYLGGWRDQGQPRAGREQGTAQAGQRGAAGQVAGGAVGHGFIGPFVRRIAGASVLGVAGRRSWERPCGAHAGRCAWYSENTPSSTCRRTPARPAARSVSRMRSGGAQASMLSQ